MCCAASCTASIAVKCSPRTSVQRLHTLESWAIEVEQLCCGALLPPDTCFEAFTP